MFDGLVQSGPGVRTFNGRRPSNGNVSLQAGDLPTGLTILSPWKQVSAATTAANGDHLLVDTRGGPFAITLPAVPSPGNAVTLSDYGNSWSTNPLTVLRNGSLIQGLADDLSCNYTDNYVQLVYQSVTLGWTILALAAQPGVPGPAAPGLLIGTQQTLAAHRVLMAAADGSAITADPTTTPYVFLGLSLAAATPGSSVGIFLAGLLSDPSWSWTPLAPLFAAPGGLLTQTPPTTGISHQIATALTPTSIFVNPQPLVTRA